MSFTSDNGEIMKDEVNGLIKIPATSKLSIMCPITIVLKGKIILCKCVCGRGVGGVCCKLQWNFKFTGNICDFSLNLYYGN